MCPPEGYDPDTWFIGLNVAYVFWLIYLILMIGTVTDGFFVPTLTAISSQLRLNDNVAGVTLVAIGTGAADIFSAIASFTNPDPKVAKLAIGSLLGAGMLVTMVVSGICMIISPLKPPSRPFLRDIIAYVWGVYWLLQCLYKGKIELSDAVGFLSLYIVYVAVVVIGSKYFPNESTTNQNNQMNGPGGESEPPNRFSRFSRFSKRATKASTRSTLVPFAKNRARAYTLQSMDLQSVTSQTSNYYSSNLKAVFLPCDPHEFNEGGCFIKTLCVIISPPFLLYKWTCPVVEHNDLNRCWNKVLAVVQALATPFLFYVLLKQYEADPFGYEEGSGQIIINLKKAFNCSRYCLTTKLVPFSAFFRNF